MANTDAHTPSSQTYASPGPGRQGVTYDQVLAAIEALKQEGQKNPTLRGIRERTGGSLGTVQKHYNAWRQKQAPAVKTELSLPPEVQRVIVLEMEKRVQETSALLDQELRDARVARDQLAEDSEQQAERINALAEELDQLRVLHERANGTIESLKAELEQARADAITARADAQRLVGEARGETDEARGETETVRTELAKAELRLEQLPILQADNRELREKLDAEVIARTTAERNAAVAQAVADELKSFRQRAADFEQRLDAEHDLRLEAEKTAASLRAELDTDRKLREQLTAKAKPAGDVKVGS